MKLYFAGHAAGAKGGRGGERSLIKAGVTRRLFSFYWSAPVRESLKEWKKNAHK